ncbi:MAG: 50S ribosomal protein L11 methyltransferase [Halocynthiibacter sp.]
MPTYTALTTVDGKANAETLGQMIENMEPTPMGVGVFEIEDDSGLWEVGVYFVDEPDETPLLLATMACGAKPFVISEVPDEDWVAKVKRELAPVEAGQFFVYGSHDADAVPDGKIPLLIEAAMAFGTGHHGTTLGCLRALDRIADDGFVGKNVIDVGCGTAVLAMAAAKIWDGTIIASDIDEVAVDVARANAASNGLEGRLHCLEAAGFAHPEIEAKAPFDLIFANILKGPLMALAPDMATYGAEGAYVILSGILNEQSQAVQDVYKENGFRVLSDTQIGDWTTLLLQK